MVARGRVAGEPAFRPGRGGERPGVRRSCSSRDRTATSTTPSGRATVRMPRSSGRRSCSRRRRAPAGAGGRGAGGVARAPARPFVGRRRRRQGRRQARAAARPGGEGRRVLVGGAMAFTFLAALGARRRATPSGNRPTRDVRARSCGESDTSPCPSTRWPPAPPVELARSPRPAATCSASRRGPTEVRVVGRAVPDGLEGPRHRAGNGGDVRRSDPPGSDRALERSDGCLRGPAFCRRDARRWPRLSPPRRVHRHRGR